MVAVSVIVPVVSDFEQAKELIRSLDLQTMPCDDFEVVLHEVDSQVEDQFKSLAAHRPNIKLVSATEPARDLLAEVQGDSVLIVGQDETLFPDALARLHGFMRQHSVDAVISQAVTPGRPVPVELWTDVAVLEDTATVAVLDILADRAAGQLLVRREAAELTGSGQLRTASRRVGVLGSSATTLRRRQVMAEDGQVPNVTVESVEWVDDMLHLVLRTPGNDSTPGDQRAVLQLRHGDTGETFLVPAETSIARSAEIPGPDMPPAGQELTVDAAFNPTRTPVEPTKLPPGCWHVDLILTAGRQTLPVRRIPWSTCPPALIAGTAVVPAPTPGGSQWLTLDVGPMQHALLNNLNPADGKVVESVVGSELVLDLPQLHVFDTDRLDGSIALGKIQLPAHIRVRNSCAQLVALVSGFASRPAISAQFGPGPLRPTGLSLHITGMGAMWVVKTPAPADPIVPAKPPSALRPVAKKRKKRKVEPPRTGLAADLRRAVPAPLEPVVKRLAASPAARRLYRRVTH